MCKIVDYADVELKYTVILILVIGTCLDKSSRDRNILLDELNLRSQQPL